MTKPTPIAPPPMKLTLLQRLIQSESFAALYEARRIVFACFATVIILATCIGIFLHKSGQKKIREFEMACTVADSLAKGPNVFDTGTEKTKTKEELFTELQSLAERCPAVKKEFGGIIAQEYILRGDEKSFIPYAKSLPEQLQSSHLALFSSFTQMVILMSEGHLDEALALARQAEMQPDLASYPFLERFFMLHKAALLRKLGQKEEFRKCVAWLSGLAETNGNGVAGQFAAHLQDSNQTLLQFFEQESIK
jgi:hypothetical protein